MTFPFLDKAGFYHKDFHGSNCFYYFFPTFSDEDKMSNKVDSLPKTIAKKRKKADSAKKERKKFILNLNFEQKCVSISLMAESWISQ